jgi:Protein of unknown function (DUF3558)
VAPRLGTLLTVAALAAALAGCGESERAPAGSPDNPLVSGAQRDGTDPDAPGRTAPGYRDLVSNQSQRPGHRLSPCTLVTKKQAEGIVGGALLDPLEAPQGPTCIYRDRGGTMFVSLAVQHGGFGAVRDEIDRLRQVSVGDRRAYCGVHGAPMLYLPLAGGRVLSVSAQCDIAKRFASTAVPRLDG